MSFQMKKEVIISIIICSLVFLLFLFVCGLTVRYCRAFKGWYFFEDVPYLPDNKWSDDLRTVLSPISKWIAIWPRLHFQLAPNLLVINEALKDIILNIFLVIQFHPQLSIICHHSKSQILMLSTTTTARTDAPRTTSFERITTRAKWSNSSGTSRLNLFL